MVSIPLKRPYAPLTVSGKKGDTNPETNETTHNKRIAQSTIDKSANSVLFTLIVDFLENKREKRNKS